MDEIETPGFVTEPTIESLQWEIQHLSAKIDKLGELQQWLCDNMAELFKFIQAMGQSGGGIRGLMSALKNGGPDMSKNTVDKEDKVQQ